MERGEGGGGRDFEVLFGCWMQAPRRWERITVGRHYFSHLFPASFLSEKTSTVNKSNHHSPNTKVRAPSEKRKKLSNV